MGLRENQLDHSSAGMCYRTLIQGAWIEVCKNVIKRTITNHMVAPTEVRGLKCQPMVTMTTINFEPTEGLF